MTSNAMTNMRLSIGDLTNRPNRAVVQIYTAIELVLKARLFEEHWSLVVAKNPDKDKFDAGDFVSVAFDEACKRLDIVVKDPVPSNAKMSFDALRKIRNKIVHFYTEDMIGDPQVVNNTREVLKEAWNHLHGVIDVTWSKHFHLFKIEIERIESNSMFKR
ncbi:hypothetical protein FKW50_14620 [Acetobacter pomorum]|uniref:DUF3644 domain-containing protein n=2 Tax=Acetobacteraceae TaxID=433 RepID=UPI000682BFC8|nr:DUF3644 domain-containing protein [Acetobacter pomorum]ATI12666.1 hypothetical protein CPF11_09530 [Acetobacter pomorum]AXC27197.1 hypothetical protein DS739_10875 [Acetobacter sp. JWB]KAA8430950.1 hypothetical protein FKW50_14620 [Acetobacter pomorum]